MGFTHGPGGPAGVVQVMGHHDHKEAIQITAWHQALVNVCQEWEWDSNPVLFMHWREEGQNYYLYAELLSAEKSFYNFVRSMGAEVAKIFAMQQGLLTEPDMAAFIAEGYVLDTEEWSKTGEKKRTGDEMKSVVTFSETEWLSSSRLKSDETENWMFMDNETENAGLGSESNLMDAMNHVRQLFKPQSVEELIPDE